MFILENLSRPSQCSKPQSKLPTQQTRTFLVQLKRQTQAQATKPPTTPVPPPAAANLQLTNLPYFIRRTASNQFPVYLVTKAGGTKQQTKIQKTEGDVDALRSDLALYLGLESGDPRAPTNPDVSLNRLNGHITVKVCLRSSEYRVVFCGIGRIKLTHIQGWRKPEILKFLSERNF